MADPALQAAPHLEIGPLAGRVLPLHVCLIDLRTDRSRFDDLHKAFELTPFPLPDSFHRIVSDVAHPARHPDLARAVLHMGAEAHALHTSLDHHVYPLELIVLCHGYPRPPRAAPAAAGRIVPQTIPPNIADSRH